MNKILLAEDDISFLRVLQHILRRNGYEVVSCTSGETAIELINLNNFLAVITDFKMGRVSGLRVARTALGKKPPIPAFILSAYAEGLLKAHDEGLWGQSWHKIQDKIFAKPLDEPALVAALKNLESSDKRLDETPRSR